MKKTATILKPKKPIREVLRQIVKDKEMIQKAISEGKEHELKGKIKLVGTL